jgi:hypothetical protein
VKSSHGSTKSLSGEPCFMEINTKVLVENSGFYAKFPTLVTWRPSFFAFPSRWHQINPRESNTCFQGTDGRIGVNTTSSNHDNLAQDVSTQSTLTAMTLRAWLIQASSSCHTWLEALKMLTGHNALLNQPLRLWDQSCQHLPVLAQDFSYIMIICYNMAFSIPDEARDPLFLKPQRDTDSLMEQLKK